MADLGSRIMRRRRASTSGQDLGLLALRLTAGGLLAGHGAQKLFGWFGGYGLEGTSGWLESLGLRPGRPWAIAAGGSEFGGGLLTALGLLHPVGPLTMLGPMSVAVRKVHWGKPIWVTEGGAELPVINLAVGVGLALAGPGRFSLDRALGPRLPTAVARLLATTVALGVIFSEAATPVPGTEEEAGAELQAGEGGAQTEPL